LLITGKNVLFFAVLSSLDHLCLGMILLYQYRKHSGGKLRFSVEYAKKLLGTSKHFILSGMMISIYGQTDKLMLKQMIWLQTSMPRFKSTKRCDDNLTSRKEHAYEKFERVCWFVGECRNDLSRYRSVGLCVRTPAVQYADPDRIPL
jgi:hypothetical protein